ncbi:ATP-binding cassette domain-containing protein [Ensifer adhaerens]|uniref:ABC transporter ATP-binding protein n=1 Tax=Ensifer adhaerens TaxID=106592 RepID=UPI001CC03C51|nr:ATP-binding cassette domain-containing protein [Ensifer adhaerens]MBZ7924917.1 ATP-binding cassette domain-containing protein [Ensifer adhaerens]UAX95870.1 ATP-binding cassette domain-containing protein [Ensifer adhaerens]UAY04788.1 ATP-binding cassette domain-containing protein [Ensifer adhaerens]UAY10219.1 ATP-binding cassette domain-containing protein [Ensifer adhaerens]
MIVFDDVTKRYAGAAAAVNGLSLEAPKGKLTVFVGPSGCGKTTSLRMVNRLITPTSGKILLDGEPTDRMDVALLRRRIGYVIQHAGLFPHRTVVQNIATTARLNGIPKAKALKTAHELLERVGLTAAFADRYPWQLSGGQQQRVGVARALASDPKYMLMDEPFSAVDPVVRAQLQDEFLRLQRDIGKTIIMVTHDIDEALKLGDQVAVLRTGGTLAQIATPQNLLARPADSFVADFIGRDRGYRILSFAEFDGSLNLVNEPVVSLGVSPEDAKKVALDRWVLVADTSARPIGWADTESLRGRLREGDINLSGTLAPQGSSLRHLLDAALSSPSGRGVVVRETGELVGSVTLKDVVGAIQNPSNRGVA